MGPTSDQRQSTRAVPLAWPVAALAAWLGLSQLLLWRFLDTMPVWAYAIGLPLLAATCLSLLRQRAPGTATIPAATLLACFLIALILLILGAIVTRLRAKSPFGMVLMDLVTLVLCALTLAWLSGR